MWSPSRRRVRVATVVVVASGLVGGGIAYAAFPDTNVDSYTGCLVKAGELKSVALGDSPAKACGGNETVVHLSGGDITKVVAGPGLAGGGDNGAVTLSLASQSCPAGQFANGVGSDGQVVCSNTPVAPDPPIWIANSGDFIMSAVDGNPQTVDAATLDLPAGHFFVTLTGSAFNVSGNKLDVDCFVEQNASSSDNFGGTLVADFSPGGRAGAGMAGSGIASSTHAFKVIARCESFTVDNAVEVTLSAVRVGTIVDQSP